MGKHHPFDKVKAVRMVRVAEIKGSIIMKYVGQQCPVVAEQSDWFGVFGLARGVAYHFTRLAVGVNAEGEFKVRSRQQTDYVAWLEFFTPLSSNGGGR